MSEKPKLQLGEPPSGVIRRQNPLRGVWVVVLLQTVTLVAVGLLLVGRRPVGGTTTTDPDRLAEIRETAISLEDRSLAAEAAATWLEYLRLSPDADDRAQVLYRVGNLLIKAEDFSGAVSALVASEQLTADDEDLKSRLGPKIVQCLRRLGLYGEVGRELSRQVEVNGSITAQSNVLATFAGETLTEADLDRVIENTVDRLLAVQPAGARRLRREQLLKQYATGEARQGMLQEIIQRQLFSRRARELEIDREDSFRQAQEFLETELLAGQFLLRELEKIQPTEVDLESFYIANQSNYQQPETASVVVLPLQDDQSATDVLADIQSADDFRERVDEVNGDADVAPIRILQGQPHPRLGDTSGLFDLAEGRWTTQPFPAGEEQLLVLLESKAPATTLPLSEIRFRVESDYRRRKQQELIQQLSADLMSRYDVRIVAAPSAAAGKESPQDGSSDTTTGIDE